MTITREDRAELRALADEYDDSTIDGGPDAAAGAIRQLLEALDQADARIKAVEDVLDRAEAAINRHPAYTRSGHRMDPIINGADIRRALDGEQ